MHMRVVVIYSMCFCLVCPCKTRIAEVKDVLSSYKAVCKEDTLLKVSFTSINEYLFYLVEFAKALFPLEQRVIFYLAAAVSDFYIPQGTLVSLPT